MRHETSADGPPERLRRLGRLSFETAGGSVQGWCGQSTPAVLLALAAVGAPAADAASEQIVGAIDAVVFACAPIDAKSAKEGLERLERARVERKLDIAALRKTSAYKAIRRRS